MESAFLLLGTNLGDRLLHLTKCREKLTSIGKLTAISGIYETAPWGLSHQPEFWNQAIRLETSLEPLDLLKNLKRIELESGRRETVRWGPREIDIDILFFGALQLNLPELTIPHPRLQERKFALVPLMEIAPQHRDPLSGKTVEEMYRDCTDELQVRAIYL